MLKKFALSFVLALISTFCVMPALAWNDVGHQITAYVAWQRMTPAARAEAIRILRRAPEDSGLANLFTDYGAEPLATREREFFMLSAAWADIVRDREFFPERFKKYHKGNWHYADTFWKQRADGTAELLTGFKDGGQGVTRLYEFDTVLKDPKASDQSKALAIAWMLHISGDLHQPLHTSARVTELEPKGDQGGNLFLLSPAGVERSKQVNLHWYWDSIVDRHSPLKGETCARTYIEAAANKMMKRFPYAKFANRLELGKYSDWQQGVFKLNPTNVFSPDLKRNQMPSAAYEKKAFRTAAEQLVLAGYRLGETFNAILAK